MRLTVVRRVLSSAVSALLLLTGSVLLTPTAIAAAGAVLHGQVLGEDGRPPSTHTRVTVQQLVGGVWTPIGLETGYDYTDWSGTYRIEAVPAGSYRVEFEQLDHLTHHVAVTLAEGEDRVLDVVLDRGAAITGTVSVPAAGPGVNAFVRIFARSPMGTGDSAWQQVDAAFVEPSGAYSASGFPGGTYRVGVLPVDGPYPAEYHPNVATVGQATDLTVADDGTVTGIDFDLGTAPVAAPAEPGEVAFVRPPRLSGKAVVGKVLRVRRLEVSPTTATVSYRWFVGTRKVRRDRSSLRLRAAMTGKRIRVKVVARAEGHTRASVTLRSRTKVRR